MNFEVRVQTDEVRNWLHLPILPYAHSILNPQFSILASRSHPEITSMILHQTGQGTTTKPNTSQDRKISADWSGGPIHGSRNNSPVYFAPCVLAPLPPSKSSLARFSY
jgi:hypothetical protein